MLSPLASAEPVQACVRALWLTWHLFNKWANRREQRQRRPAAVKSIHLQYNVVSRKSLRFNVGWQWVDISLTVTECWNHFLLDVKECEEQAWSVSPWRSVIILILHACIKYGPFWHVIWTAHKSSLWEYEVCVFWFVLMHTAHMLLTWCVCLEWVREACDRSAMEELWDGTAAALLLFILSSAGLPRQLRQGFKFLSQVCLFVCFTV